MAFAPRVCVLCIVLDYNWVTSLLTVEHNRDYASKGRVLAHITNVAEVFNTSNPAGRYVITILTAVSGDKIITPRETPLRHTDHFEWMNHKWLRCTAD